MITNTILDFLSSYHPISSVLTLFLLLYTLIVQFLRFNQTKRNVEYVRCRMPLTPVTAQPVVQTLAQTEFPMLYQKSLEFALFRTYGIPSISRLLKKTSLFSAPATAGRRYADTKVLVAEILGRDWGSTDFIGPMARLNAIHGHYRGQGKITEEDMLYTLSLFAQQTTKWIDRFEWRCLSREERNAQGTFWRGIGEMMEINYNGLGVRGWEEGDNLPVKANGRGKGVWRDGEDWLMAVDEWAEIYERNRMKYEESNALVATQTIQLLLFEVPKILHPIGQQVVASLMDTRLRKAMKFPPPSTPVHCTVMTALLLRKYFMRWLMLPRPAFLKVSAMTETHQRSSEGNHHLLYYDNYPYYVEPSLANRWGPRAWIRWFAGLPLPGDEGMDPHGYNPTQVGPSVGKAKIEQSTREQNCEEVLAGRGCPLAFAH